jgi:hypothetical protein
MTNYEIKVLPRVGSPFTMTYESAEDFSGAVLAYDRTGIKIECDRSLMVRVDTRLSRLANYAGD